MSENDGSQFDRLPAIPEERTVEERPTRGEVLEFFADRFGIPSETFEGHSFWEKGAGKVWAYAGEAADPTAVEALGMTVLRVRQEHWKPTTDAAQRFGRHATRNVIHLDEAAARRFLAGEDQDVAWNGDWGYLLVTHHLAGDAEPLGVGLYLHGELRSRVPKARQRTL